MKNLVQGHELLDGGLKNYIIQKIFMTYKCLEITAKSEDSSKTVKLQFEGIEDIVLGKYSVESIISKLELEKMDDNKLIAQIKNSKDIEIKIVAKKLLVTKI